MPSRPPAEPVADVLRSRGYEAETAHRDSTVELAELDHLEVVLTWSDLSGPKLSQIVQEVRGDSSQRRVAAVLRAADTTFAGRPGRPAGR